MVSTNIEKLLDKLCSEGLDMVEPVYGLHEIAPVSSCPKSANLD
jgi:hypothetical protein